MVMHSPRLLAALEDRQVAEDGTVFTEPLEVTLHISVGP